MRKEIKKLEQEILEMAHNFQYMHWKENAEKELTNVRAFFDLDDVKSITWIVGRYPDFDHIEFKVETKNKWAVKICIAPQMVLDDPKIAKKWAKMAYYFIKRGATKVRE